MAVLAPARSLEAQTRADRAVPIVERYDPVTGRVVPEVPLPLPPRAMETVQAALRARGHDPGALTGVLDRSTRAALRSFQVAEGLRITSHPDFETVRALGIPVRPVRPAFVEDVVIEELALDQPGRRSPGIVVIGSSRRLRVRPSLPEPPPERETWPPPPSSAVP